jgi:hypothetical protein
MDFDGERVWLGTSVVETVHVLKRDSGRREIVIVLREGEGDGLAEWLTKAAALHDAARRRMEDPDGD